MVNPIVVSAEVEMSTFHADHGVDLDFVKAQILARKCRGKFLFTMDLPPGAADLKNNLYGPANGDAPVKGEVSIRDAQDSWRGSTPFVNLPPRPTRLLTAIGMVIEKDGKLTILLFTAYGGPAATRLPSDPDIESPEEFQNSIAFWGSHALSIAAKK